MPQGRHGGGPPASARTAEDIREQGRSIDGFPQLRGRLRDGRDRFIASDPGWSRLRLGIRAVLAVASTALLMALLATALDQPVTLVVLLGAVVAMVISTGIRESRRRTIAQTAMLAPAAAAIGVTLAVLTAEQRVLSLLVFVAVSFVAVWVRRFGPRWFTLGFLLWQGFFFSLFLHPPPSSLPFLLAAVLISCLWVGLLLLTILYDDPESKLRRIVSALRARARSAIAAAVDVLENPADDKRTRVVHRNLVQLREVALLLDGQLADTRATPDGIRPTSLRRWTVDIEIGVDELCGAALAVAAGHSEIRPQVLLEVRRVLESVGRGEHLAAKESVRQLEQLDGRHTPSIARLTTASSSLVEIFERWDSGQLAARPTGPDPLDEDEDAFEKVVTLINGNLPGSAALAEKAIGRDSPRRLSPSRMRLTTRQAIQAALAAGLAIVAGEAISNQRFYWAVIAAFIGFAGTATSGETLAKGTSRIAGTLAGLVATVVLANVTSGNPPMAVALILVCIFFAYFLQPVLYSGMIFFITVMLGQLYTLLGTFSDELLGLRLLETAAGAGIGIVVSLLVLPSHSRATLRVARQSFLVDLGELLDGCAQVLGGQQPQRDLLALTVQLDASARQVVRTRKTVTVGRLFGADRAVLRHRISVLGTCGAAARALAGAVSADHPDAGLSRASAELATESRRLSEAAHLSNPPALQPGEADALDRIQPLLDTSSDDLPDALHALRRLSDALALLRDRHVTPST